MEVEIGSRRKPKRSGEVSSTLPRSEEEPFDLSYAAAGCGVETSGFSGEGGRTGELRVD